RVRNQIPDLLVIHSCPHVCGPVVRVRVPGLSGSAFVRLVASESEYVEHGVSAGLPARDPARSSECSLREHGTIQCFVHQLDPLTLAGELHAMLANGAAATNCVKADLPIRSHTGLAAAAIAPDVMQVYTPATSSRFAECDRSTTRRIDLPAVVCLHDLDVVARRIECGRHALRQPEQQVHAQAEVRCRQYCGP